MSVVTRKEEEREGEGEGGVGGGGKKANKQLGLHVWVPPGLRSMH